VTSTTTLNRCCSEKEGKSRGVLVWCVENTLRSFWCEQKEDEKYQKKIVFKIKKQKYGT
jgi:hypothetical protein